MNQHSVPEKMAAIAVALLLLLTAWGNAIVMLIVALLGCSAVVIFARRNLTRGGFLATTVGLVVEISIGLVKLLQ